MLIVAIIIPNGIVTATESESNVGQMPSPHTITVSKRPVNLEVGPVPVATVVGPFPPMYPFPETKVFFMKDAAPIDVGYVVRVTNNNVYPLFDVEVYDPVTQETKYISYIPGIFGGIALPGATEDVFEPTPQFPMNYGEVMFTVTYDTPGYKTNTVEVMAYTEDQDPMQDPIVADQMPIILPKPPFIIGAANTDINIYNMQLTLTKELLNDDGSVDESLMPTTNYMEETPYRFTITNIGDTIIEHVELTDLMFGLDEENLNGHPLITNSDYDDGYLSPGEEIIFEISYLMDIINTSDDLWQTEVENVATVFGHTHKWLPRPMPVIVGGIDLECLPPQPKPPCVELTDTASKIVYVNEPGLEVVKEIIDPATADVYDHVYFNNQWLYYRVTIRNIGLVDFTRLELEDHMCKRLPDYDTQDYNEVFDEGLPVGGTILFDDVSVYLDDDDYGKVRNHVEVYGYVDYWQEDYLVKECDSLKSLIIEEPTKELVLEKYAGEIKRALIPIELPKVDPLIPPPHPDFYQLPMGSIWRSLPPDFDQEADDLDLASPTQEVVYKFIVTNNGNARIEPIIIRDTMLFDGPVELAFGLDPGESSEAFYAWPIVFGPNSPYMNDDDIVINTAYVDGYLELSQFCIHDDQQSIVPDGLYDVEKNDEVCLCERPEVLGTPFVQGQATEWVKITMPDVLLTKWTDQEAYLPGELFDYHFKIENTGNMTFNSVWFEDMILGMPVEELQGIYPFEPGDVYEFDYLDVSHMDEDWYYNEASVLAYYEYPVMIPGPMPIDLNINVEKPGDELPVLPMIRPAAHSWDFAWVRIDSNPSIDLTKRSTDSGGTTQTVFDEGDQVRYELVVTNNGSVRLEDITLTDDDIGLSETIDYLEPGDYEVFEGFESYPNEGSYTNHARVEAYYLGDEEPGEQPDIQLRFSELEEEEPYPEMVYAEAQATVTIEDNTPPPTPTPTPTPSTYTLVVSKTGEGTVNTGTYSGLSGTFNMGEFIPAEGWVLDSIIGDDGADVVGPNTGGDYTIAMNQNREVEVVFVESTPPQALPVDLVIVVTGEGNIESQTVNFASSGESYVFGPLFGDEGWSFNYIGGPDSTDLLMIDPIAYSLLMNESKEIHIEFVESPLIEEEIMDEETPEASPLPATGGIPFVAYVFGGLALSGCGVVLKKKRK